MYLYRCIYIYMYVYNIRFIWVVDHELVSICLVPLGVCGAPMFYWFRLWRLLGSPWAVLQTLWGMLGLHTDILYVFYKFGYAAPSKWLSSLQLAHKIGNHASHRKWCKQVYARTCIPHVPGARMTWVHKLLQYIYTYIITYTYLFIYNIHVYICVLWSSQGRSMALQRHLKEFKRATNVCATPDHPPKRLLR